MTKNYVETAERIARRAHRDQHDKLGADYIEHPARVAERVLRYSTSPQAVATAWLHDVLEDTEFTAQGLSSAGVPGEVVAAVELLSKREGQSLEEYCAGLRANPIALAVKQADLDDNTDPARTTRLPEAARERLAEKYARTRHLLGAGVASTGSPRSSLDVYPNS